MQGSLLPHSFDLFRSEFHGGARDCGAYPCRAVGGAGPHVSSLVDGMPFP